MVFPRSRDEAEQIRPFWRRWRGIRTERMGGTTPRVTSKDSGERFHQLVSWAVGGVLVLVIVAVLVAGYKDKFWDPPRAEAGSVRGVSFSMGDLVQRIRIVQGITGSADLITLPFEYLQRLLHAEVLRQDAEALNINVNEEIVDDAIHRQHDPNIRPGQTTDPGQLEEEFRNNLQIYLDRTGLSQDEYRGIVKETLQRQVRYFQLGSEIEDTINQIEVEWIRLDVTGGATPTEVVARLQNESFASVARSVGVSSGYADESGYVGWVPRQAFKEIGALLFGDEKLGHKPLNVGATSSPLFTADGIYIVHKLSGPEILPISNLMRFRLNGQMLEDWEQERLRLGASEGWVQMNFNSDLYQWVADQVALSAPRNSPSLNQSGNQPAQR